MKKKRNGNVSLIIDVLNMRWEYKFGYIRERLL